VVVFTFPGVVITGGVVSTTLTLNVAGAEVLPDASLAVQETVVVPRGKAVPEDGLHETVGAGSTMSVALTVKLTVAVPGAGPVASAVIGAGTVTPGGVVSTTVTLNGGAGAPLASMQFTVVVPSGNIDPEASGPQFKPPLS
jgi:hypothetical protein